MFCPHTERGHRALFLEAMAMGRAIVTTNAPGCRETVLEGENGFMVPVKNSEALAAAMERFIIEPDLATRMGRASQNWFVINLTRVK